LPQAALERLDAPPTSFEAVGQQLAVKLEEIEINNQPVGNPAVEVLDGCLRNLGRARRIVRRRAHVISPHERPECRLGELGAYAVAVFHRANIAHKICA
jgi:hypothetical protein